MDVSLDNMLDLPRLASRRLEIDIHIALGIDDGRDALRSNHVRCVSQTTEIESLHLHRFHAFSPEYPSPIAAAARAADRAELTSSPPDTSSSRLRLRRKAQ